MSDNITLWARCGGSSIHFLQFIEQDNSDSLIVAATKHPSHSCQALFRRFDDVLCCHLPTSDEIRQLVENRLERFRGKNFH